MPRRRNLLQSEPILKDTQASAPPPVPPKGQDHNGIPEIWSRESQCTSHDKATAKMTTTSSHTFYPSSSSSMSSNNPLYRHERPDDNEDDTLIPEFTPSIGASSQRIYEHRYDHTSSTNTYHPSPPTPLMSQSQQSQNYFDLSEQSRWIAEGLQRGWIVAGSSSMPTSNVPSQLASPMSSYTTNASTIISPVISHVSPIPHITNPTHLFQQTRVLQAVSQPPQRSKTQPFLEQNQTPFSSHARIHSEPEVSIQRDPVQNPHLSPATLDVSNGDYGTVKPRRRPYLPKHLRSQTVPPPRTVDVLDALGIVGDRIGVVKVEEKERTDEPAIVKGKGVTVGTRMASFGGVGRGRGRDPYVPLHMRTPEELEKPKMKTASGVTVLSEFTTIEDTTVHPNSGDIRVSSSSQEPGRSSLVGVDVDERNRRSESVVSDWTGKILRSEKMLESFKDRYRDDYGKELERELQARRNREGGRMKQAAEKTEKDPTNEITMTTTEEINKDVSQTKETSTVKTTPQISAPTTTIPFPPTPPASPPLPPKDPTNKNLNNKLGRRTSVSKEKERVPARKLKKSLPAARAKVNGWLKKGGEESGEEKHEVRGKTEQVEETNTEGNVENMKGDEALGKVGEGEGGEQSTSHPLPAHDPQTTLKRTTSQTSQNFSPIMKKKWMLTRILNKKEKEKVEGEGKGGGEVIDSNPKRFIHISPLVINLPTPVTATVNATVRSAKKIGGVVTLRTVRRKKKVKKDGEVIEVVEEIVEEVVEDVEPPPPLPSHLPVELLIHILGFLIPPFHNHIPHNPLGFHTALSPLNPNIEYILSSHQTFVRTFTALRLVNKSFHALTTPDLWKVVLYVDKGDRRLGMLARCGRIAKMVKALVIGHSSILGMLNDFDVLTQSPLSTPDRSKFDLSLGVERGTNHDPGSEMEEAEVNRVLEPEEGEIVPSFGRMLSAFKSLQVLQWDQSSVLQMLDSLQHTLSLGALSGLRSISISNEKSSPDIVKNDNLRLFRALDWNAISRCIRHLPKLEVLRICDKIMSPATILLPGAGVSHSSHFNNLYVFPRSVTTLALGNAIVTSTANFQTLLSLIGRQLLRLSIRETSLSPDKLMMGLTHCENLRSFSHIGLKTEPSKGRRYMDRVVQILPPTIEELDFMSFFGGAEWIEDVDRTPCGRNIQRLILRSLQSAVDPPTTLTQIHQNGQNVTTIFQPALVWSGVVHGLSLPSQSSTTSEADKPVTSAIVSAEEEDAGQSSSPKPTRVHLPSLKHLEIRQPKQKNDWVKDSMPTKWVEKLTKICEQREIGLDFLEEEDSSLGFIETS